MKILVFSDSHRGLSFMRNCVDAVKPDVIIHLGDHYEDGENIHQEYPHIRFYQVPGNCDLYSCPPFARERMVQRIGGVDLYLTHGHTHHVKQGLYELLRDARACGCAAALYGHTHIADCRREEDGIWILNPGASGYGGRSAGLIEIENNKIITCRNISSRDLEEFI